MKAWNKAGMNAEIRMGIVILLRKKRKRHYCGSLAEMEREKDEGGGEDRGNQRTDWK